MKELLVNLTHTNVTNNILTCTSCCTTWWSNPTASFTGWLHSMFDYLCERYHWQLSTSEVL